MTRAGVIRSFAAVVLALGAAAARAELCIGPLDANNFGRPVDYGNPLGEAAAIQIVEKFHFTAEVEALVRGTTSPLPMDIDYTLRQIPNHYRALNSMAQWQLRNQRRPDAQYQTVDCYFERAFAFRPDDGTLYMLYGIYLHKSKQVDRALQSYERAEALKLNSSELAYNMGLLYVDRQEYAKAREYAAKAYGAGYPLLGLRHRLERLGQWREPGAGERAGASREEPRQ